MKMETSLPHAWFVRNFINSIGDKTGAGIRCPDVSSKDDLPKKYTIWIRGNVNAIYKANCMVNVNFLQLFFF